MKKILFLLLLSPLANSQEYIFVCECRECLNNEEIKNQTIYYNDVMSLVINTDKKYLWLGESSTDPYYFPGPPYSTHWLGIKLAFNNNWEISGSTISAKSNIYPLPSRPIAYFGANFNKITGRLVTNKYKNINNEYWNARETLVYICESTKSYFD